MKCEVIEAGSEIALYEFEPQQVYRPAAGGRTVVRFQFNLDPDEVGDALFSIESPYLKNRTKGGGRLIYSGRYRRTLDIVIDHKLTAGEGFDHLRFYLLQVNKRRLCGWANSESYPYWRAGRLVNIDFLYPHEYTIDDEGLKTEFNITLGNISDSPDRHSD